MDPLPFTMRQLLAMFDGRLGFYNQFLSGIAGPKQKANRVRTVDDFARALGI